MASQAPSVASGYFGADGKLGSTNLNSKLAADSADYSGNNAGKEVNVFVDQDGKETTTSNGGINAPVWLTNQDGSFKTDANGNKIQKTTLAFDGSEGYESSEFGNQYESGATPGKDLEVGSNEDMDNAAELGATQPSYDPKDCTMAYVGQDSTITSAKDIIVTAYDDTTAEMITATVAGGAYAGVGT